MDYNSESLAWLLVALAVVVALVSVIFKFAEIVLVVALVVAVAISGFNSLRRYFSRR